MTNARDFEVAELKANHAQTVNLVMNRSSELDSKLKQFKLVAFIILNQSTVAAEDASPYQPTYLPITQQPIYQPSVYQSPVYQSQPPVIYQLPQPQIIYQTSTIESHSKLEIGNGCSSTDSQFIQPAVRITTVEFKNQIYSKLEFSELFKSSEPKQKQPLTSNIPPTIITENKFLAAIFLFEIKKPTEISLFNKVTLEEKLIMAMYTNTKINGQSIKLILDSGSAGSIIIRQFMDQLGHQVDHAASAKIITADGATKTSIGEIDALSIEVNSIIVPIKILVIEAT
ncbi:hypothetical protein G9A89_000011 [Geosiphon pyriformis]|nr:hypothetical protein G9A89_000011 [Geosiphon pyriformis]